MRRRCRADRPGGSDPFALAGGVAFDKHKSPAPQGHFRGRGHTRVNPLLNRAGSRWRRTRRRREPTMSATREPVPLSLGYRRRSCCRSYHICDGRSQTTAGGTTCQRQYTLSRLAETDRRGGEGPS